MASVLASRGHEAAGIVVSKFAYQGREPADRLPVLFSLSRLRGRAGVGAVFPHPALRADLPRKRER
jgi:hypothetical protein